MKEKNRQQIKEEVNKTFIPWKLIRNKGWIEATDNVINFSIDLAISKTTKAIFDEELFRKKFTKTERESLENKYGVR